MSHSSGEEGNWGKLTKEKKVQVWDPRRRGKRFSSRTPGGHGMKGRGHPMGGKIGSSEVKKEGL